MKKFVTIILAVIMMVMCSTAIHANVRNEPVVETEVVSEIDAVAEAAIESSDKLLEEVLDNVIQIEYEIITYEMVMEFVESFEEEGDEYFWNEVTYSSGYTYVFVEYEGLSIFEAWINADGIMDEMFACDPYIGTAGIAKLATLEDGTQCYIIMEY